MLGLQPANPEVIKKWRTFALANAGASGALGGIVPIIKRIFPQAVLGRFPDYEIFIYAAIGISLITVFFLLMIPKVIALSVAQIGGITSLIYISYSLAGIFLPSLLPVFLAIMILAILIMIIVFGESLNYFLRQRAYYDFIIGCISVIVGVFACSYPIYLLLS
jgi:hypothetical protein